MLILNIIIHQIAPAHFNLASMIAIDRSRAVCDEMSTTILPPLVNLQLKRVDLSSEVAR